MNESDLRMLLDRLVAGEVGIEEALRTLRSLPFADLGYAKVDHHRMIRLGVPETVFGPGKTPDQVAGIVSELMSRSGAVLVTRADTSQYDAIRIHWPQSVYHPACGLIVVRASPAPPGAEGFIVVASAGTSDQNVAEEAALTAEALGLKVERLADVGVAGLHRLIASREVLEDADAIIVVAGMDGVLPSIIGGLVAAPVIAVPTSVGYGAGAGGLAPLLTMLNSCAPGVAVVNIDNGFGAAVFASVMLRDKS